MKNPAATGISLPPDSEQERYLAKHPDYG